MIITKGSTSNPIKNYLKMVKLLGFILILALKQQEKMDIISN